MKKMMICLLLVSLVLLSIISVPVAAATEPSANASAARSERLERRQAILDLRITLLEKQLSCLQMARENNAARIELRELLSENRETLTLEEIEALKAINQEIKSLFDKLRDTRGDVRKLLDALHDGTPPSLEEIESTYGQISDILEIRLDLLSKINELLFDMIGQLKDPI